MDRNRKRLIIARSLSFVAAERKRLMSPRALAASMEAMRQLMTRQTPPHLPQRPPHSSTGRPIRRGAIF